MLLGGMVAGAEVGPLVNNLPLLTRMDFNIVGLNLTASPSYQAVPKGISSQVNTAFEAGSFDLPEIIKQLPADYTVRADLTGPGFKSTVHLVARPGDPFILPTLVV
jgi:hypothetical protein